MSRAQQHAAAFHSWHSKRTWDAGHPQIDPWMRDVLVALQGCLNELAKQIDEHEDRLDRLEHWARQQR